MTLSRISKMLTIFLAGGALLQATTTSCEETIAPLVTNLIFSIVLESLVGGLAT